MSDLIPEEQYVRGFLHAVTFFEETGHVHPVLIDQARGRVGLSSHARVSLYDSEGNLRSNEEMQIEAAVIRGDDGLTDEERQRLGAEYAKAVMQPFNDDERLALYRHRMASVERLVRAGKKP